MARDYYSSPKNESTRKLKSNVFAIVCLVISSLAVVTLITLLSTIVISGGNWIDWNFLTGVNSDNNPEESGIGQALIGSAMICLICATVAIPIGIGTAIFLEEFPPKNKFLLWVHGLVQLNISNLAGVPSIVYGILGLSAFVYMFNVLPGIQANARPSVEMGQQYFFQTETLGDAIVKIPDAEISEADRENSYIVIDQNLAAINEDGEEFELKVVEARGDAPQDENLRKEYVLKGSTASILLIKKPWYLRLPFGESILSAALTLALVILPIVIISAQEAIRAVPRSIREAAFGMGATRWQLSLIHI